MHILSNICVIR